MTAVPAERSLYNHNCRRCPLHKTAKTVCVEARGRPGRAMVIGEAPGRNEDRVGRPFIGTAGRILDYALSLAGFNVEDVFVTNVVKCRPPRNRNPLPAEIDACFSYLSAEVQRVDPVAILCLGNVAASVLLGQTGISSIRGRWYILDRDPIVHVLPTYHPAYVSYQGGFHSETWDTFATDVRLFYSKVKGGRDRHHTTR